MSDIDDDFVAEQALSHLNTYIKLADQKASILLSGQLVFIGLYLNWLDPVILDNKYLLLSNSLVFFTFLIAILSAGSVIMPRTHDSDNGLFLWESILDREDAEDYKSDLRDMSQDEVFSEVLSVNYQLAQVATRKYRALRWALGFSAAMVLMTSFSVVIWAV